MTLCRPAEADRSTRRRHEDLPDRQLKSARSVLDPPKP
jgi:hypothetical protein